MGMKNTVVLGMSCRVLDGAGRADLYGSWMLKCVDAH